ncbi:MAG: hypothetical protein JSV50_07365 [Desulfobacteraceae bacterium]|nr:MAG: hypothetical protein JSV50_07365 [Desulfobacteraceae bacterium]
MKWDIFFSKKKEKRHQGKDEFDEVIAIIEKFAPKKYRSERDAFYYNYRIMAPYPKPLLSLLQAVSRTGFLNDDHAAFAQELFIRLKAFYDPKEKLSPSEATKDMSLKRKFRELFLFFYDKRDISEHEIEGWLKDA